MDNNLKAHRVPLSTTKDHFSLHNTVYNMPRDQTTEAEKEYYEQVKFNHRGL